MFFLNCSVFLNFYIFQKWYSWLYLNFILISWSNIDFAKSCIDVLEFYCPSSEDILHCTIDWLSLNCFQFRLDFFLGKLLQRFIRFVNFKNVTQSMGSSLIVSDRNHNLGFLKYTIYACLFFLKTQSLLTFFCSL